MALGGGRRRVCEIPTSAPIMRADLVPARRGEPSITAAFGEHASGRAEPFGHSQLRAVAVDRDHGAAPVAAAYCTADSC